MSDAEAVDLLWTGGWDSTFRLLQLVHGTEILVRPHYLVDEERPSLSRELTAMREIREAVEHELPDAMDRLLPTEFGNYQATEIDPRYARLWEEWNRRGRVGPQYAVLASYAQNNDLRGLELCIFGGEPPLSELKSHVEVRRVAGRRRRVLPDDVGGLEALFERFAFPLLGYTKLEMEREAEESRFLPVLERTWFCHDPVFGLPCGACIPCNIAREEGLGRRVGWLGPLLHRVRWRFRD